MRVRIIAGEFGGRFLTAPPTSSTHPMGERIRGAIFNKLGDGVQGAKVLDAFAGSGVIGLEALSRGAKSVVFVEKNRVAAKVIDENRQLLGLDETKAQIIKTSVMNWIETAEPAGFDLIFADPPYYNLQFSTIKTLMGLLKVGGCMVLSHTGKGGALDKTGIVVVDNRSYGNACITFYRRVE